MKSIFIAYNQAFNEEIIDVLNALGQRGYTKWENVDGCGSNDGEPHLGNHAWPVQNHAVLVMVEDEKVSDILSALKKKDDDYPDLGLRAFVIPIEASI